MRAAAVVLILALVPGVPSAHAGECIQVDDSGASVNVANCAPEPEDPGADTNDPAGTVCDKTGAGDKPPCPP